jgi:hypothetical protein
LLPHQFHQLGTGHCVSVFFDRRKHVLATRIDRGLKELLQFAGGEAGVVLDFRSLGQLPHGESPHDPVFLGHRTLEQEGFQVGSGCVNRGRPPGWATPDDDAVFGIAHAVWINFGERGFLKRFFAQRGSLDKVRFHTRIQFPL